MRDLASTNEEAVSFGAISSLAEETPQPVAVVKEIYDRQYASLKARARIPDYE